MSDWRDFSTAPKDGTVILVYRKDQGTFEAHYVNTREYLGTSEVDDSYQWWSTDGDDLTGNCTPTHWMPLPEPPK